MNKKIKKHLDILIDKELSYQNIKDLKEEYDEDFNISVGKVIGLSIAIRVINNHKKFKNNLSDLLLNNEII